MFLNSKKFQKNNYFINSNIILLHKNRNNKQKLIKLYYLALHSGFLLLHSRLFASAFKITFLHSPLFDSAFQIFIATFSTIIYYCIFYILHIIFCFFPDIWSCITNHISLHSLLFASVFQIYVAAFPIIFDYIPGIQCYIPKYYFAAFPIIRVCIPDFYC